MRKNLTGAVLQLALLVIGIPVVYLVAFPFGLTAKSLLPPLGLLAGLVVAGVMVKRTEQPVSGPLTGWLVFGACMALALAL
ncbi:hypothetical protein [Lentzea flaviverrucosa]|uniref:Uncharacterized protein n=1 Tax=Lentzea flaviverrucosa TaxID=200379 RepID=A0A1H9R658_9PSEU|nr:hypothetical protein [Lentzea flaviverrucosa]RDI32899.1 hypothetical protein DFR72_102147 [Lentzea flaviverrucosa]SER68234.1 hypothetical protein SAMN05216195_106148 [Lentzea flaviverrucosa]